MAATSVSRTPVHPGGLTAREARARLAAEGANELPHGRPRAWLRALLDTLAEPMILLLLACGALYFFLGDTAEALLLTGSVCVIAAIEFRQERRAERTLAALRDLSSPRAEVVRDGARMRIAGREVVRGDILLLSEGDRVPADAALRSVEGLQVDESVLTGESVAVRKRAWDGAGAVPEPGGDDTPFVWSGTLVIRGRGIAEVVATGGRAALGRIGRLVAEQPAEATRLQKEVDRLVRWVALVAALLCVGAAGVRLAAGAGWAEALLAGLTLAMAMVPEEFPVVLAGFQALGAWRLAKERVLTRRTAAIETLGAATVLCADKTGTLTENRQRLAALDAGGTIRSPLEGADELPEEYHALMEYAILASQRDPFDPIELAIRDQGEAALAGTEHLHGDWTLVREYPLTPELLSLAHVWRAPDGAEFVIAAKGATEAIADLCHLDAARLREVEARTAALAARGLRVLAVARARFSAAELPGHQHDFDFEWCGLLGFEDPVRAAVPAAVRECAAAGVRVMMITGDHPGTARHAARAAGLDGAGALLTGAELDALDEAGLAARLPATRVCARFRPDHKLRMVRALRASGEVVAMTGDGVNDAPALKGSDIGVAMGARGTDVAREAADLVLLEDDFTALVAAVRTGRRIFANLNQALVYLLACHLPIAGLSLIPALLGWPLLLLPVHIVLLELIIDPAAALVFEAEVGDDDLMRRPPRDPRRSVLRGGPFLAALAQGAGLLAVLLALVAHLRAAGAPDTAVRAHAFAGLVLGNLALVHGNRSPSVSALGALRRPNAALWAVTAGALGMLALAIHLPALRGLFHVEPLDGAGWLRCAAAAGLALGWVEALKLLRRPPAADGAPR